MAQTLVRFLATILAALTSLSYLCAAPLAAESYLAPSTQRMADRLARLALESDPLQNPFLNRRAAGLFEKKLREAFRDPNVTASKLIGLRYKYAHELLHAGESEEAVAQYVGLRSFIETNHIQMPEDKMALVRMDTALAYLRLGEQENCLANHTIDSCLMPIQPGGFHTMPRGSQGAIGILMEQLGKNPNDLQAGWLLNLAHMTLGGHPGNVPPFFLIPPKVFACEYDIKRFTDAARGLGLDLNALAGSVVMDDFDNDGNLDLMISSMGVSDPLRFFHNRGDGTFQERTNDAGLKGEVGGLNMVQADYNNDGYIDVLVLRGAWFEKQGHHPNSLLRNNGDGTFSEVAQVQGLYRLLVGMAGNFGDLDNDGFLDLYLGTGTPDLTMLVPNRMFRNGAAKRFQDVTTSGGFGNIQKGHGIAFGDLDNDGDADIYASIGGAYEGDAYYNALFHNPGHGNDWLKLKLVGSTSNRAAIGARIKVQVETLSGPRTIHRTVNSGGTFGASPLRQEFGLGRITRIGNVEIWWPASGLRQLITGLEKNRFYEIREETKNPKLVELKTFKFSAGPHVHTHAE